MELIEKIGAFAGLASFLGLAVLALLSFAQGRDIRRLREWAGSAPERDAERKETTSVLAAQRAEEMRRLEAQEAEREAAREREERRQRREAGLPAYSWSERIRDWLSETRWIVGLGVVALALAAGVAYTVLGDGDEGARGKGGGESAKRAATPTPPAEIEVTVLNGTAVPGLAATYGDKVERKGYRLGAVTNSSSSFVDSVVMFERGSAPEARRVARQLDIPEVRLMTPEIAAVSAGAPVAVVVGEDNAATAG